MKRKIRFIDGNKSIVKLEVNLDNGTLSITGECNLNMGQCYDKIKPANDLQKQLIDIWKKYHLNGISAGTEEQEKVLELVDGDYDTRVKYLKTHNLKGEELKYSDYERLEKAIEEYKNNKEGLIKLQEEMNCKLNGSKSIYKFDISLLSEGQKDLLLKQQFRNIIQDINGDILKIKFLSYTNKTSFIKDYFKNLKVYYPYDLFISAYIIKYNGKPYFYGSSWIKRELPLNFEFTLNYLLDKLDIDNKENEVIITIDNYKEYEEKLVDTYNDNDIDDYRKFITLLIHEEIPLSQLEEIIITQDGNNYFTINGNDYLVCYDDEADDEFLVSIENLFEDLGWELFTRSGINTNIILENGDVIISQSITIPSSDRGNELNRYDGIEYTYDIEDEGKVETIYLYKQ